LDKRSELEKLFVATGGMTGEVGWGYAKKPEYLYSLTVRLELRC
jgi:hypothetical protein